MPQQQLYQQQQAPAQLNVPDTPRVLPIPDGAGMQKAFFKAFNDLNKTLGDAFLKREEERQSALVDDAYIKARQQMTQWQTEYQKTHQAADALNAQQDYDAQWGKIQQGIIQSHGSKISGKYIQKFNKAMALGRLYALNDGGSYENAQLALSHKNNIDATSASIDSAINSDDIARVEMEFDRYKAVVQRANPGKDISSDLAKKREDIASKLVYRQLSIGNIEKAEQIYQQFAGITGGSHTQRYGPSKTGFATVLSKFESGKYGSQHVSYGLPITDGVDVGKYSFITKGGKGGTVGEFVRWAGTQGGVGKRLYDGMSTLVGGAWDKLDSKQLWKDRAETVWKETAKSDPLAFEQLEDQFMKARFDRAIEKLSPEVQAAIRNDKTGALYEMAISTINQHKTAIKILNTNYDSDPEKFIRKVYQDRSNPTRFAQTGDPNIGVRRMSKEVNDVLSIYRSGGKGSTGSTAVSVTGGQESITPKTVIGSSFFSPKTMVVLQNALDSAKRQKEQKLSISHEAFSNHISFGMETGDFSAAENDIRTIQTLGGHKDLFSMANDVAIHKSAYEIMKGIADMPLMEQEATALAKMNPLIDPENAKQALALRNAITSSVKKKQEAFRKDPALFVKGMIASDLSPQERLEQSLKLQLHIGKGMPVQPKLLPKDEAEYLRAQYDNLKTSEQRTEFMLGLYGKMGDYTANVLKEMKMPATINVLLPLLGTLSNQDMGACLTALTIKPSDLPKMEEDQRDTVKDLTSIDNFDLYAAAQDLVQHFPGNDEIRSFARGVQTMAYNYLRITGKDNLDSISDSMTVTSDNGCFAVVPKTAAFTADDLSDACDDFREQGRLKELLIKAGSLKAMPTDVPTTQDERIQAMNLDAFINNSYFILMPDGKHMALFNGLSEREIKDKDGVPIMIDVEDILKARQGLWENVKKNVGRLFDIDETEEGK